MQASTENPPECNVDRFRLYADRIRILVISDEIVYGNDVFHLAAEWTSPRPLLPYLNVLRWTDPASLTESVCFMHRNLLRLEIVLPDLPECVLLSPSLVLIGKTLPFNTVLQITVSSPEWLDCWALPLERFLDSL